LHESADKSLDKINTACSHGCKKTATETRSIGLAINYILMSAT
jgi:hypothetical protein